jgi:hypothetical protein
MFLGLAEQFKEDYCDYLCSILQGRKVLEIPPPYLYALFQLSNQKNSSACSG